MNNIKSTIKEYSSAIIIVALIFIITPLVKYAHDELAERTFTAEKWEELKPLIVKSCEKNVQLKTSGGNYFSEGQMFYLFICNKRELVFRLDEGSQWTWGDFISDSDFFIYKDAKFLSEVLKVWEKSVDYQMHLTDFEASQRKEGLTTWLLRQRDKLNNKAIERDMDRHRHSL